MGVAERRKAKAQHATHFSRRNSGAWFQLCESRAGPAKRDPSRASSPVADKETLWASQFGGRRNSTQRLAVELDGSRQRSMERAILAFGVCGPEAPILHIVREII